MFSFLGCSKRVKICKSDIPVAVPVAVAIPVAVPVAAPELAPEPAPEPVDHQDIHVQTIDPTDVLEPVSKLTESMPIILPGQPVMDDLITSIKEVETAAPAEVEAEAPAEASAPTPILYTIREQLANDLMARILKADKPFYRALPVKEVEVQKAKPKNAIRALYNHHYWPSPRPVNFVRCLYNRSYIPSIYYNQGKVSKGRLTHEEALNILASYGSMTVDELLQITPVEYLETKFKCVYSQIRTFSALQGVNACY